MERNDDTELVLTPAAKAYIKELNKHEWFPGEGERLHPDVEAALDQLHAVVTGGVDSQQARLKDLLREAYDEFRREPPGRCDF